MQLRELLNAPKQFWDTHSLSIIIPAYLTPLKNEGNQESFSTITTAKPRIAFEILPHG